MEAGVKKVVPKRVPKVDPNPDPLWGAQGLTNTRNSKGFGAFTEVYLALVGGSELSGPRDLPKSKKEKVAYLSTIYLSTIYLSR